MKSTSAGKKKAHKVGLAQVDVTPTYRPLLAGYSDPDKKRRVDGVHDPLLARALVLESPDTAVAILSVPVVSVDASLTLQIRKRAAQATGLAPEHIMVHATHSHSAPVVKGKYKSFLRDGCVQCLKDAWASRFPGRLGVGAATVEDVGRNRRCLDYGGLPVDPEAGIIKVEDARGRLRGVVFNYACHGTTLGYHNRLVSEDWPYFAIQALRANAGKGVMGIFLQGASGDINPGYSAGLSAVHAEIPIRTWEQAEKLGERMAVAILKELDGIAAQPDTDLGCTVSYVDLPLRRRFPVTRKRAERELAQATKQVERLERERCPSRRRLDRARMEAFFAGLVVEEAERFYGRRTSDKTVRAELQTIGIGNSAVTTFPGEVFVEVGLDVKQRAPADTTLVVELANAFEARGYMPTREAFAEGDYEVYSSYYDPAAAEVLAEASVDSIARTLAG